MIIRKAVIPAAGLGLRMFPASQAVKKELSPVVGPDGIARALIHYHILELVEAGIEEIAFVIQPGSERELRRYFMPPAESYLRRLQKYPVLAQEAAKLAEAAGRLHYIIQSRQEGYGHAVFQARDFSAGEPVLLLLGDHLFRGARESCSRLMLNIAGASPHRSISAVNRIGPQELKGYGTIAGRRTRENPLLVEVSAIVEKPEAGYARTHLRVDGLADDEFLGWFGMHVLTPSIFQILDEMIQDELRDNGEFQLTRAQEIQRRREGYLAYEMTAGRRYDFGTPQDYLESLAAFARPGI
jgi:UTP--glucose-1-phosphate uridylyltransferase